MLTANLTALKLARIWVILGEHLKAATRREARSARAASAHARLPRAR